MTFSGSSYVRWRLTVPMEMRLNLRLELRTVQPHARLMHAVGRVDYSILEVRRPVALDGSIDRCSYGSCYNAGASNLGGWESNLQHF